MKPTSKQLALRDPALAVLLGAIAASDADFGMADFGMDDDDDYGWEFAGWEFGDENVQSNLSAAGALAQRRRHAAAGAAATASSAAPHPAVMQQVWNKHQAAMRATASRESLMNPNKNSTTKVERYSFAVNQALVLGVAVALNASGSPDVNIRPQRVTMNAPTNGFITVSEIKVANVSVTVGGIQDAFDYSSLGVGQALDIPLLTPSNKVTVLGNYTGFVPPGFVGGTAYTFAASFKGPATIVA